LVVIFAFFREDIKRILSALVHSDFKSENGRLIPLIIVGSIPTALIGFFFSDQIESTSENMLSIAVALIISGALLYSSKTARERTDNIGYPIALLFGIAQGISIIPGISRSGTTIAVALLLGIKREKAFKFSFLLSIPSIIGALGLTIYKEGGELGKVGLGPTEIIVGAAIAMIVGFFALRLLHRAIETKKFHLFSFYCWIIGIVVVAFYLSGF
jgi:undecaprenyl-diphosphatase